jgi:hypothetical protein
MIDKIKNHVAAYNQREGYGTSDTELFETIREAGKQIYSETKSTHRWYDKVFVVVELDGVLIGYDSFHTTGDDSWSDMGLEHDINTICEVEKKQKTIDYYIPIITT